MTYSDNKDSSNDPNEDNSHDNDGNEDNTKNSIPSCTPNSNLFHLPNKAPMDTFSTSNCHKMQGPMYNSSTKDLSLIHI